MNVEIFVTLGYLANKFVVLCHSYLKSQTVWSKTASVGGDYNQFALFFIYYPQQLELRRALNHWDKRLPGSSISRMIYCVRIWTCLLLYFLQRPKISWGPGLLMELICWLITWSRPRCPFRSQFLVHSENYCYFVGIGKIRDVEFTCIFQPVFSFGSCIEDRSQYYNIKF